MLYNVKAKPKNMELQRFWTLLNDGTINGQEPDGREIVASMKRAVFAQDTVEWSETCFCNPPLNHERSTVYDHFFSDILIERHTRPVEKTGEPFWRYMQQMFDNAPKTGSGGSPSPGLRHVPLRLL